MATEVVNFLPSEIARLVLGYLSEEGYVNSYKCFIKECPHLSEYLTLKRRGQTYPLHVNGLTLCQTLQEYAHFKLADTQRRQMMGVAAMWSQLDAVVRTLKEHTASKQNPRVNGLTQSSRVRRLIQDKKRQRQSEKLQKMRDLCKRTSATVKYASAARIGSEAEKEMEVTESDVSEGEVGNCGVLTPPTDTETKGLSGKSRKIQESYRRQRETDNRETEFILHSAPPSVSSHHKHSTFQRSSSISNLLNISSQRLQKIQSTAFSRTEQSSTKETDMETSPKNVIEGNPKEENGAIQCISGVNREECMVEGSSQGVKIQERETGGEEDIVFGTNCDNTLCVQPNECDGRPVNMMKGDQISESVTSVPTEKGNFRDRISRSVDERQTSMHTFSNGQDVSSPIKPSRLQDEKSNSEKVLEVVLSVLPAMGNLQSSLQQPTASSEEGVKGQNKIGQDDIPPTSSEENSQESAESGPSNKTLGFQQAVSPSEMDRGVGPPGTPVKRLDEASQMSLGRTPRRKRLPRQKKHQRKGSATLNDSNKTEENSLLMENITLFLNEFLNNPSLHERLAENINRTLSIKTTEKRSRKKSGKAPKIQENPKPNKPEKSEGSTACAIPEESESNYSQNLESQGLYTFLDDILNINETQMTETQIGGIIELTSKDPNFESLFNLFQEPHSASETQKTDFSGIRLEMGKEASINNSSLPSFTDCPDPSNTTSEENLIMEILQSPQPVPALSSSYPPEMLDQTAQSQPSDKVTPSSDMDWSSGPPNKQSSSNPTARNIFKSFQQFAGCPDSSVQTLDLHEVPQSEKSDRTESKEGKVVESESLPAQSDPTNNSQQLQSGVDGIISLEQRPSCLAVTSLSLVITSSGTQNCEIAARSSPGPVLSLINSVRSPSVQLDLNQVRSPLSSENQVPCQSPQVKNSNAKSQEGHSACSPHPYTKLTDKVSVSGEIPINRISVVHSPVQKAIFTNQPLSPLQVCVPKPVQQPPNLSSPNIGPLTPCGQENRISVGSPSVVVGQTSTISTTSPLPSTSVQAADNPSACEQRLSNCETINSLKTASPLHRKEKETGKDSSSNETQGTSSLPKPGKSQKKKKGKSTSKKGKKKSSKVSSNTSEKPSDSDLVETFETCVTEDLGFPVISIKSIMKSPKEVSVLQKDKNLPRVKDTECQQMSYKSFIRGFTGEECSTPVTEKSGPRASPHTSQSSANSNEILSEMIGLVSSLEKSQHGNSSSEKSSADFDKGKRNNSKTRKDKKEEETCSSSPSKKLQWSPDLKALLKLVTPEKKGKSKGKKSKKAIKSAEKRRNPNRKARRSNEENIKKDEPETGASSTSVQKNQSPLENVSKDIPNSVADVTSKMVETNKDAISMPALHTFMSPVQVKSSENNSRTGIKEKKSHVSDEVGLTPKTVLTAVSALKDNGKTSSRKSLSLPINTEQVSLIVSRIGTLQAPNAQSEQVLAEPTSSLGTLSSDETNQTLPAVHQEENGKPCRIVETDYNKILYSPSRDFLDSPPRYKSPGIAVSLGGQYQGNISTTCNAQFESPCEPILYSSQIITPTVYVLNESTSQHNSIVVSGSQPNVVYTSGMSYTQNTVSYQGQVMNSGDQALNYNTVYIDSNGIVQASSNSVGQNIVPVSSTTPDVTPTPVTDILSAAAAVIHSSPLHTVDSYQLNSTPETQREDKQESIGQLLAYPVGRYYPEKKLHVRSLNFGPEAGTTEIRKPGYGRGHKKKSYDHFPSPVKPGGRAKKQAKGKAKSKVEDKGMAKTDNGSKEDAGIQDSSPKVVIQKQDNLLLNHVSKTSDEADDFIPDASGSVYILEGNTRKKIKLHKTPRSTKTMLPYFLPNRYELSQGIIPLTSELCKKSESLPHSSSLPVPEQFSKQTEKFDLDKDSDSEVDVDGDCDLPDLSPEAPRKETPKSKCLEMVQLADLTTPVKSFSSSNADLYVTQPYSVQSVSDSWNSKGSNSPSVGNFPTRPTSSFSNNSNSLPDLHSPSPLINMSTPPKKRITASLKHGGGCYFFSSSSQEGKSQAKAESKENGTPNSVAGVPHSPRTPKGKRTPSKPLRQSPRLFRSPSRRLHSLTTPTKSGAQETVSNNNKGVKRLREINSGENSKAERKSKKARNGKRAVDLNKVDFEKFLDKIHKM